MFVRGFTYKICLTKTNTSQFFSEISKMSSIICYSSPKPYYDPLKTMKHHQNKIQSPNPLRHIYFLHVVAAELNPPPSAAFFKKMKMNIL